LLKLNLLDTKKNLALREETMRRLLLFITTSAIIRFLIWVPLRFIFLRFFGLYVGEMLFNVFGGIVFLYVLERFFVLFQEDDGRGMIGVFIPEWVEKPVAMLFWKITRPIRRQYFIAKHGYPPIQYQFKKSCYKSQS
jgi:hypothetical protein